MKKADVHSTQSTRDLLKRLAILPNELSLPILYKVDSDRLNRLCSGIHDEVKETEKRVLSKSTQTIKELAYFCKDVNFWRDWLLENDYDLPQGLPELVQALKDANRLYGDETLLTDLDVLNRIFFDDDLQRNQLILIFGRLLNKVFLGRNQDYNREQVTELALDLHYLWLQIEDRQVRGENQQPRNFNVNIGPPPEFLFPNNINIKELLQFFVDNDIVESILEEKDHDLLNGWLHDILKLPLNGITGEQLYDKFGQQVLATLPKFIREGDTLIIVGGYYFHFRFISYYVGPQQKLIKITIEEEEYDLEPGEEAPDEEILTIFFPEEALTFFEERKIKFLQDVQKYYPLSPYKYVGFIEKGQKFLFPRRN